MRPGLVLALATLLPGLPAVVVAQGLGDVAAREREERQKKKAETKEEVRTFSNDDLEGLAETSNEESSGTVSEPGSATVSPGSAGTAPSRTPTQARAAREQPYQARVDQARARVQALEARLEDLRQRLNPMSTTYIYGSTGGPVGGTQADEEQRVRSQITALERQLAQEREALRAAEAALQRARRGGGSTSPSGRSGPRSPDDLRQRN
jgi:hypothetical protein